MADPRTRQIKIKTGVVRRLAREEASYVTEARQQEERIERMVVAARGRDDDNDECDIRKQREVLQECHMMIPDCRRRLAAAHGDLCRALQAVAEEGDPELAASQEVRDARGLLEVVRMEEEGEDAGGLLPDAVKMEDEAVGAS